MSTPHLEIKHLSFTYSGRSQPVLHAIDLTIAPGELVLIAGSTGSGKSTLLNCLAGITPHYINGKLQGDITHQGVSIVDWSIRQRSAHIGTVLQNVEIQLFTDRVEEELAFGLENLNTPAPEIPKLVNQALAEFGLVDLNARSIRDLSAGQKQRLVLAAVLMMGQSVLLLDEPFAYLDRSGADSLLTLLRTKADQGQAILLVEHRLDLVRAVCDRAYAMKQGQLLEWSPAQTHQAIFPISDPKVVPSGHLLQRSLAKSPPLLLAQSLSWNGYPPFPELAAQAGETILLQGDNGCGKTTLLKLLSGLVKSPAGKLEIQGEAWLGRSVLQFSRLVGFVLQNPNHQLFSETVRDEVLQPGVALHIAEALLNQLALDDRLDQHPQSLSQGQKRRLALGAVLARQPRICLLDEITVGQDPNSLMLMLTVLKQFTHQGGLLILTSHDPQVPLSLDARRYLLQPSMGQ